jgi:BMFP domain-containing protein YqiC
MFRIEHPDDYLARISSERELHERRNRLARALRGAIPPFDDEVERELRQVMRDSLRTQTEPGR